MKCRYLLIFFIICWLAAVPKAGASSESHGKIGRDEVIQLWTAGQKSEARLLLKRWRSISKKSADPLVVSAQVECEDGRYKKCLSFAEKALARSPLAVDAYYWKGRAYMGLDKSIEAANELQAAIMGKTRIEDAQKILDELLKQMTLASHESN